MKGNSSVIEALNQLVKNEITATNQYYLHSLLCDRWGYSILAKKFKADGEEEQEDFQKLVERILFLEGEPIVDQIDKINSGKDVKEIIELNLKLELANLDDLKKGVDVCQSSGDHATRIMLSNVMLHESEHIAWHESQLSVINDIGLDGYLSTKV